MNHRMHTTSKASIASVATALVALAVALLVPLSSPSSVAAATTASGGYRLVGADGSVYPFGNAASLGSLRGIALAKPIVGSATSQ